MNIEKQNLTREEILEQTYLLLEPWLNDIDESNQISEEANLLADMGLDSVAILQLILEIEKQFNITIQNNELDSDVLSKMANLIDIIEGKVNETN
jgi:acyl carrier protein